MIYILNNFPTQTKIKNKLLQQIQKGLFFPFGGVGITETELVTAHVQTTDSNGLENYIAYTRLNPWPVVVITHSIAISVLYSIPFKHCPMDITEYVKQKCMRARVQPLHLRVRRAFVSQVSNNIVNPMYTTANCERRPRVL